MKFLFVFIVIFFGSVNSFSQTIYLHIDRSNYFPKDTLWFNAYIFESQDLLAAPNQTFYTSLINPQGKSIVQKWIVSENGKANNFISLPDSLSGTYQIVAFTKNNQENVFRKNISVLGKTIAQKETKTACTPIDVQFLPEGGHLVAGLPSLVAIKATDSTGNALKIEGQILNQDGEEISIFQTNRKGFGSFVLTPIAENIYFARFNFDEKKIEIPLPQAQSKGIVLQLKHDEKDSLLNIKLFKSDNIAFKNLQLRVYARGKLSLVQPLKSTTVSTIKILKSILPKGVLKFVVAEDTTILLERLACVHRFSSLKIETTMPTKIEPNKEVTITILVRDKNNEPVEGDFSMSVTDSARGSDAIHSSNLMSYLFLEADLRGNILEPSYYFDSTQAESFKDLDLLLLTQGWSAYINRFENMIETSSTIQGIVYKHDTKKVVGNVTIVYRQDSIIGKTSTDENGIFVLTELFKKESPLYIQASKNGDDNLDIAIIDSIYAIKYEAKGLHSKIVSSSTDNQFAIYNNENTTEPSIELNEVVIKTKSRQEQAIKTLINETALDMSSGINFAMQSFKEIINDKPEITSLVQLINKKVPDLSFITIQLGEGITPMIINVLAVPGGPGFGIVPVKVFKNKTMVCDVCLSNRIEAIVNARDVTKLIYFSRIWEHQPALILITKDAIPDYDYSKDKIPGVIIRNDLGINPNRQFYSPKYENGKQNTKPDYRATLYWNPNIKTDKDGKATVSFYNSDIAKKFNISIEGTDGKGNVGSLQKVVE